MKGTPDGKLLGKDSDTPNFTHQSVIKTTFLLYHAAVSAIAGG